MTTLPAHPDSIPGLETDCRRVLREEFRSIQVAADRRRTCAGNGPRGNRTRSSEQVDSDVAAAVGEYRRTAALWGVEV
ncbi:MAG: hypothetical protein ACRCU1_18995 [Alsobacter sp.]